MSTLASHQPPSTSLFRRTPISYVEEAASYQSLTDSRNHQARCGSIRVLTMGDQTNCPPSSRNHPFHYTRDRMHLSHTRFFLPIFLSHILTTYIYACALTIRYCNGIFVGLVWGENENAETWEWLLKPEIREKEQDVRVWRTYRAEWLISQFSRASELLISLDFHENNLLIHFR